MRRPGITRAGFFLVAGLTLLAAAPAEAHKTPMPAVVDGPGVDAVPVALPESRPPGCQPPLGCEPRPAWTSEPTPSAVPWIVLLALAASTVAGTRHRRRALAALLVLVLAVFAFETGLHSVHHLNDRGPAASCGISLVSEHEAGGLSDCLAIDQARVIAGSLPHPGDRGMPITRSLGPHRGRAPPARPA